VVCLPGLERSVLSVQMPDGSFVEVSYFKLEGGSGGPVVYIHATQHGVELTGIYTIKLLLDSVLGMNVNGTIILVPVANPLAVRWRRHFYKRVWWSRCLHSRNSAWR